MALDATVGGATSNSYVTQAVATSYLGDRLATTAWTAASSGDKDASLIMATLVLDTQPYEGSPVFYTQALAWPRYMAFDIDGRLLSSLTIPTLLVHATIEYAFAILKDTTLLDDTGLLLFNNIKLGSLDVTPHAFQAPAIPYLVRRLIAPIRRGGMGASVTRG